MNTTWPFFLRGVTLQTSALFLAALTIGVPLGFFEVELVQAVGPVWRAIIDHALSCVAIFTVCAIFAFWRPHRCFLAMALSFVATELIFQCVSLLIGGVEQPSLLVALTLVLSAGSSLCGTALGRALKRNKINQVDNRTPAAAFQPRSACERSAAR